jgi:thiamine-monophosphate kinase
LKLKQFGEFKLIELIKRRITGPGHPACPPLVVGPGDDTFVARTTPGRLIAATTDILVENIHFSRTWTTPEQLGYKSITVNLSDLAAMGWCEPRYALVGLVLTPDVSVEFVKKLYSGMRKAAARFGLMIAGGDTVSSKNDIMISVTLIGELRKEFLITRSGAKPGDAVLVSGTFGDSAGGLEILEKGGLARRGGRKIKNFSNYLIKKHLMPEPRLALAKKIAVSGAATSMIDSSDGLSASVKFISESSGTGAVIDIGKIPVSKQLREFGEFYPDKDIEKMVLHGGEEYELVFTVKKQCLGRILRSIPGLTQIGWVTRDRKIAYTRHGLPVKMHKSGYEHFR